MKPRLLSILCVTYILLILYASIMPFDFSADPEDVTGHYRRAWQFWPFGSEVRAGGTDLMINFALYVPLGFLVAARGRGRRGAAYLPAFVCAVLAAAATSAVAESLQLLSMRRIAGAHDLLMNTIGGAAGGLLGVAFGRSASVWLRRRLRLRWARGPVSSLGLLLLLLLAADAVSPFRPALDYTAVARSAGESHWVLSEGLALHPWHRWLVQRGIVYAILAGLLAVSSASDPRPRPFRGCVLAIAFAAGAELSKLFIISRQVNVANVAVSACAAVAGSLLCWAMAGRLSTRAKASLAIAALAGYLAYLGWTPFTFVWDPAAMAAKMPRGALWLPLSHYALSGRPNDVRLFVRTLTLLAALTCASRLRWGWLNRGSRWSRALKAAPLAAALGLILELGQFPIPRRVPSVTDVFCFALGAAIGAMIPLAGARSGNATVQLAHPVGAQ